MSTRRKLWLFAGVVGVTALLILIPLKAADLMPTDQPQTVVSQKNASIQASQAHTVELLELLRIWMLARDLELSKDQLIRFAPTFEELQRLKQQFREQRRGVIRRLEDVDRRASTPDEEAEALAAYSELEDTYWEEVQRLTGELNSMLTSKQQVKFALFNDTYRKKMQQLVTSLRQVGEAKQTRPGIDTVLKQQP